MYQAGRGEEADSFSRILIEYHIRHLDLLHASAARKLALSCPSQTIMAWQALSLIHLGLEWPLFAAVHGAIIGS
jgi:hypothetical protein